MAAEQDESIPATPGGLATAGKTPKTGAVALSKAATGGRIASVDTLRGLTILLMVFVNDLAGSGQIHIPWWLKHFYPYDADGMTIVDVVFPAFLFIVGMAIPLAIGRALDRGKPLWRVLGHVLIRWASLLIIGIFMVNYGRFNQESNWPAGLWPVLVTLSIFAAWHKPSSEPGRTRRIGWIIRGVGAAGLLALAVAFWYEVGEWMPRSWYGIIGLIGWAYLVSALLYIPLRKRPEALVAAMALLYGVWMASQAGLFDGWWIRQYVNGSMVGSHAAISMAGILLGMVTLGWVNRLDTPFQKVRWAILFGIGMAIGALLLDPLYGINKNTATPSWCLWCSAITAWTWVLLYLVMDVIGWRGWAKFLQPAGANPLLAYMLPTIVLALVAWTDRLGWYSQIAEQGFAWGVGRSIGFSLFIVLITGLLARVGVRLRL